MTKQELIQRYRAYCIEADSLAENLRNNRTPPEKKARQRTRLKKLQERLLPELQAELLAELGVKTQG